MRARVSLRVLVLVAIASTILTGTAACSSPPPRPGSVSGSAGTPARGGSLDVGLSGDPSSLDSGLAVDASAYVVARAIYDPLFQLGRNGSLDPMLAAGYTASADQKTFTVTLRAGLEFSDGTPLDAAAVRAHYQRLLGSPAISVPAGLRATTITAAGDVITFACASPWSDFPEQVLAGNIAMIGSAAAAKANPARYAQYPVGAGAFMVSKYVAGSEVTVVRNPHYRQPGLPYLDSVTFHFLDDSQTRLQSVAAGSLDMMQSSDVAQRAQAESDGLRTQVNVGVGPVGIMLNTADGALADRQVRVALAQAVDTRVISQVVYKGLAPPASGFVPPDSAAGRGSAAPAYDPAAAKAAIAAYGKPIDITLSALGSTDYLDAAQLVQQMWQQAGVHVTIKQIDPAVLVQTIFARKDYQAYLSNNFDEGVPVAQSFVQFVKGAGPDPTNLDDQQLDQAYADGLAAPDAAARATAWTRAEQRMVIMVPAIPLVRKVGLFVWRKNVHGVPAADPQGVQMFDVTRMWIGP